MMLKLLKTLLLALAGLIAMIAIAVTAAFLLIDPARYRPALESAFTRQTGLQLSIAGEMSWTFRPVFGLTVNDLRLRRPGGAMELASLVGLTIKLAPRALLEGQLTLQEFMVDGLHVNWIVDENGRNNWQDADAGTAPPPAAVAAAPDAAGTVVDAGSIALISIRNASVAVQDRQRGLNARLDNVTVSSRNTNLRNQPFPLELSFALTDDNAGRQAVVSVATLARIDVAEGNAALDELLIKLNPLQLSGAVSMANFRNAPRWQGTLQSNAFPLTDFLDLYVRPDTATSPASLLATDFNPDTDQFSLSLEFAGTPQQIEIPALRLSLDEMHMDASATWTAAQPGSPALLRYSLSGSALDLDRFRQSHQETQDAAAVADTAMPAPPAAPEAELPIALLQSMDIEGSHSIASLAFAGLQLSDVNAQLTVRSGQLNLNLRPAGFHGGQLTGAVAFDTRQTPPSLTSILSVQNMDIAQLARSVPAASFAQGRLNLESFHTLRGRTLSQLLDSVNGSTSFSVSDNAMDIGIVKQLFSAISVLSPAGSGDLAQQWPDVVRFASVEGSLSFTEGIGRNQHFTLQLDNFEIDATGGITLAEDRFEYAALLTVYGEPAPQTIAVAPLYQGVGWPVLCSARFDAEYSQYCGPDFGRVRELFVDITRNQVQRRVQDAVSDQVPGDLQDAARSLLDRVLR